MESPLTNPKSNLKPLILPVELQSKSSISTDIDKFPFLRGFSNQIPFFSWTSPETFSSSAQTFHLNSGKPRTFPVPRTKNSSQKMTRKMTGFNDHLLEIQKRTKHNKSFNFKEKKVFKMRCRDNCLHSVEVFYKTENEVIVRFLDKCPKKSETLLNPAFCKKDNIILEFFKFCSKFKNNSNMVNLFAGSLSKRNSFDCPINFENIRNCMMDFFKNKSIRVSSSKMNDFENLYFGIFILKKNFVHWSLEDIDLEKLQNSETKKRKEHFLKFILKKLFKYLNNQNLFFFGNKNKEIVERMKEIFFEGGSKGKKKIPHAIEWKI